ncbi:MAG TPA: DUF2190 family protein [Rhodoglobus sp.]|mgnify:CR=1 FL=1|nr:DUF2190 family protein [Rhodoglobus sp.]
MANECIPLYRPGSDITAVAGGAITGKTFVKVSAGLNPGNPVTGTSSTLVTVVTNTAAGKAFGVATYDAASGARLPIICGPGNVVPVTSGAAVTAGAEVESDASGRAITLAAGKPLGMALSASTGAGQDLFVRLY